MTVPDEVGREQYVFPVYLPRIVRSRILTAHPSVSDLQRILRVHSSKMRLAGDFDFKALAKATPGYVGADLGALTGAAGVVAVKRIFKQLAGVELPTSTTPSTTDDDSTMVLDTPLPLPLPLTPTALNISTISSFLAAHPNPLTPTELEPLSITYSDFLTALPQIQPSSKREGFATIPDVSWSDVGALHSTREELQMAIVQPIRRPEIFKRVGITAPCGVLMWGPPGCGKTLLAKAVANESRANFISVKGPELLNKVGLTGIPVLHYRLLIIYFFFSTLVRASVLCGRSSCVRLHRRPVLFSLTSWTLWFPDEMIAWYVFEPLNPLSYHSTILFCSRNPALELSTLS